MTLGLMPLCCLIKISPRLQRGIDLGLQINTGKNQGVSMKTVRQKPCHGGGQADTEDWQITERFGALSHSLSGKRLMNLT